jgi:predicted nucleic acid-binding protein
MAFIYFVEKHPRYYPILDPIVDLITSGQIEAHASTISLAEVLVLPLSTDNDSLVLQYRELLTESELKLHEVSESIATVAAAIRASDLAFGLRQDQTIRVADSIIAATAIASNCDFLITNDRKLRRINAQIKIALLDDYE